MSLGYNKDLISLAKELRKNPTPWEKKLWSLFLSDYPKGFKDKR